MEASDLRAQAATYGSTAKEQCGRDEGDCMTERRLQRKLSGVVEWRLHWPDNKIRNGQGITHYWRNERLEVGFSEEEKSV